jgi:hypothetical protein
MDSYTIVKSFLMFMAVAVAFSFFFLRVKRLYRLMTAVEGVSNSSWTRFPHDRHPVQRCAGAGQRPSQNAARPCPHLHFFRIFGGSAAQPGIDDQRRVPGLRGGHWIPGVYGGYLFAADILAALVLVGFAYAIYRRVLLRPAYLTLGTDANLIIPLYLPDHSHVSVHQCVSNPSARCESWRL